MWTASARILCRVRISALPDAAAAAGRTASAAGGGELAGMVRGSVRRENMAAQAEKCGTRDKAALSRVLKTTPIHPTPGSRPAQYRHQSMVQVAPGPVLDGQSRQNRGSGRPESGLSRARRHRQPPTSARRRLISTLALTRRRPCRRSHPGRIRASVRAPRQVPDRAQTKMGEKSRRDRPQARSARGLLLAGRLDQPCLEQKGPCWPG